MARPGASTTFPQLLAAIVAARPDHPALVTGARRSRTASSTVARPAWPARSCAIGAGKGTRIGLLAPDGELWLTTFCAALRIGALVTPITTLGTPTELAHIVRTSDAQILIGVRRFLRRDYAETLEAALPGLADAQGRSRCACSAAPYLRSVWLDDADGLPWAQPLEDLVSQADDRAPSTTRCSPRSSPRSCPATTRSSSTPRAARRHRRPWCTARRPSPVSPRCWRAYFVITEDDRTMPLLPAFWMGGIATALQVISHRRNAGLPAESGRRRRARHRRGPRCHLRRSSGTCSPRCVPLRPTRGIDVVRDPWPGRTARRRGGRAHPDAAARQPACSACRRRSRTAQRRAGEPAHCPRASPAPPVAPSTASSAGSSIPRPVSRSLRARSASCTCAAAR